MRTKEGAEIGGWDQAGDERRRSRTNPEKWDSSNSNIRLTHAPQTKFEIFFEIFAGKLPPAQKLKFFHI